jgi:hypothetical protein
MMQNYKSPCYTLSEARELLRIFKSELEQEIRNKNLVAVTYTKPRSMLLFLRNEDKTWEGTATCTYRGHIAFPPSFITTLLDEPSVKFNNGSCTLLDLDGISNWSAAYPFVRPLPHLPIATWEPVELERAIANSRAIAQRKADQQRAIANGQAIAQAGNPSQNWPIGQNQPIGQLNTPLYACAATPLPVEIEPALGVINKWIGNYRETKEPNFRLGKEHNKEILELDFNSNSIFHQSDLRIPASEIERYKAQKAEQERLAKISVAMTPTQADEPGKRVSQINVLVDRILDHNPTVGAKEAWRLIQEDFERDDKLFDLDQIIQAIDLDCIEWRSRYGNESSLKWASFAPLLTKLKNRRKS